MKLIDLYSEMSRVPDARRPALFDLNFTQALQNEGFTPAQASIISYEAYERGHSGGYQEVVGAAMGLCEFARNLLAAK